MLTLIQNTITRTYVYPQIHTLTYAHLVNYTIHYISVFIIMAVVYCLWRLDKNLFFQRIINFSSLTVKISLIFYIIYILSGRDMYRFQLFGNINNFGAVLACGAFTILSDSITNKVVKIIYITIILYTLFYNDSKLALFGSAFGIGLYLINYIARCTDPKIRNFSFMCFVGIGVWGIYTFLTSSIEINDYNMEFLMMPIHNIINGELFDDSAQSITFRANSIICIGKILHDSYGLGVGAGNTAVILGYFLPNLMVGFDESSVASHVWWFEVMADIGWIIIIPMIKIYINQCRSYFQVVNNKASLFSQVFIISFPIWCMSPSGLYTEFYSIMLIAVSILLYRQRYEHH